MDEDNEMLTPEIPDKKKPAGEPWLVLIEEAVFHIDRRESYYTVRYLDVDGQSQTTLIGRELFTDPSKVVAHLLKENGNLPDNPKAAGNLVK